MLPGWYLPISVQSVCNQCVICDRISGARRLEAECEGDSKAMLVSLSLSSFCATLMRSNFLHERSGYGGYGSAQLSLQSQIFDRSLLKYRNIRKCTSYHFMQFHVQQCPTVSNLCAFFTRFSAFSSTLQSAQIRKEGCNPSSQLSSPQPRMSESLPKSYAHLCVPSPSEWFVCPFSLHLVPSESLRIPFCRHLPGLLHGSGKENLLIAA